MEPAALFRCIRQPDHLPTQLPAGPPPRAIASRTTSPSPSFYAEGILFVSPGLPAVRRPRGARQVNPGTMDRRRPLR